MKLLMLIKKVIKALINRPLEKLGLKIVRARLENLSFIRLFDDIALLVPIDNPVILDIGANVGQTIEAIQETFHSPTIHSFEPSTQIFAELKSKSFKTKGNLNLYNFAFGESSDQKEFINYDWSTMSSFLKLDSDKSNRFREIEETNRELVEIRTVDDFILEKNIKEIHLLKTDTQGFDLNVLNGATNALSNKLIQYVLVEINFVKMYDNQSSFEDIHQFLAKKDMHLIEYYEKYRENNTIAWCTALFGHR